MDTASALTLNFSLHPLDWFVILAYLVAIVLVGIWFGRFTTTTNDFFLGGQRFSWWVGSIACAATLVGSYSFIQYSQNGFNFGFSSITAYTNDWFVLPLFLLVWLPIIYYNRLTSVPEYFERRFDRRTRIAVLVIMLVYLQGYIGINLYTIGVAMHGLLGWDVTLSAAVISVLTGIVIYAGGAMAVMMADLIQAFLLLAAGWIVFLLGIGYLGGFGAFWAALPNLHKLPFAQFNKPAEFHFIGDFWSDAITGTIAFYFMNQSVLMRIVSVKSVHDARKTMLFTVSVLMPIAAVAVSGAGWIGWAMLSQGLIPPLSHSEEANIFVNVVRLLCPPGMFGFVMAALLAALMSTLEALINAVSAVAVNDIWKPVFRPGRSDEYYLRTARYIAIAANLLGILSIPLFAQFASIYQALSYFTAIVTPPMVIVICLGAVWRRFSPAAAFWTLLLGSAALLASLFVPELITPLAHGEPASSGHAYMRSLFGLVVALALAILITLLSRPKPEHEIAGLVLPTVGAAKRAFKGGEPSEVKTGNWAVLNFRVDEVELPYVRLPQRTMDQLQLAPGDLVYVSDARRWLGGLRSLHAKAGLPHGNEDSVLLSLPAVERGRLLPGRPVRVEKIM
ncbi:MAG TPA: sodium/solute symporter [Candidatus Acidoferrales bacterium]|nr:sodium/solute symporter [Candidatus Acidoferrales bacterium]